MGRISMVVAVIQDPKGKSTTYTGDLPHGIERGDTREDVLRRLGPPDCKGGRDWLCYGKLKLRIIFTRDDGRLKMVMITESLFGPSIYVHRMDPSGQAVYSDVIVISDNAGDGERYRGSLPHGLKREDNLDSVTLRLGPANQIVDDRGLRTFLYFPQRLRLDFDAKSGQLQVISTLAESGSALRVRVAARRE